MVREDRDFGRFLLSRLGIGFGTFALPFYVLYGQRELNLPAEMIGLLVGAQVAGAILSNVIWAELSDRVGNRIVIRLTGLVAVLIPVLTLITWYVPGSTLLVVVFALIGAQISGTGIGFSNYLLEIAPATLRPAYIAIAGTMAGLSFLLPIAGGFVVDQWGYQAAFLATAVVVAGGLACSMTLRCIRNTDGNAQQSGSQSSV